MTHFIISAVLFSVFFNIQVFGHGKWGLYSDPVAQEESQPAVDEDDQAQQGASEDNRSEDGSQFDARQAHRLDRLEFRSNHNDAHFTTRFKNLTQKMYPYLPSYDGSHRITRDFFDQPEPSDYLGYKLVYLMTMADVEDDIMERNLCEVGFWLDGFLDFIQENYLEPGLAFPRQDCTPHKFADRFVDTEGICLDQKTVEGQLTCIEDRSDHRDFHIDEQLNYLETMWSRAEHYIKTHNIQVMPNFSSSDRYLRSDRDYRDQSGRSYQESRESEPLPPGLTISPSHKSWADDSGYRRVERSGEYSNDLLSRSRNKYPDSPACIQEMETQREPLCLTRCKDIYRDSDFRKWCTDFPVQQIAVLWEIHNFLYRAELSALESTFDEHLLFDLEVYLSISIEGFIKRAKTYNTRHAEDILIWMAGNPEVTTLFLRTDYDSDALDELFGKFQLQQVRQYIDLLS